MTLQQKQSVFADNVAHLINYISSSGYLCSLGEVYRTPEQAALNAHSGKGIKNSLHCKKLAIDIQLFSTDGLYITDSKQYESLGIYWESLNKFNRWGGYFVSKYGGTIIDGNHFEMQDL